MILGAVLANNFYIWWAAQVAAILILVILFLRWRPGFLGKRTIGEVLGSALDTREEQIQYQLEAAQRSREEAARINEESQQEIAQARQDGQDIVSRAALTSRAIQEELERRAQEEYERIVGQARVQIDYERERAEMALRRRAADIVVDAAREIVQTNLEPQIDQRIIDSSLANLTELT